MHLDWLQNFGDLDNITDWWLIVVFIGYKPTTMGIWWLYNWWFGTCFFHLLRMSSSQLTNSYFFRGVGIPPARCLYIVLCSSIYLWQSMCIMYYEPVPTIYPSLIKHGLLENPPRIDLWFSHLKTFHLYGICHCIHCQVAEGDGTWKPPPFYGDFMGF